MDHSLVVKLVYWFGFIIHLINIYYIFDVHYTFLYMLSESVMCP